MTSDQQKIIEQAQAALLPLMEQINPDNAQWITGGNYDQSLLYCTACVEKEVTRLEAESPEVEFYEDGSYGSEEDGSCFCEGCKTYLASNFTDYAASEELKHWTENPPTGAISPVEAHELWEMIEVCKHLPELTEGLERVAKAVAVACELGATESQDLSIENMMEKFELLEPAKHLCLKTKDDILGDAVYSDNRTNELFSVFCAGYELKRGEE